MVEESANEEWIRVLTERPSNRGEKESRYIQAIGESRFTLRELVPANGADLSPGDRVAVESEDITDVHRRLTYQTLTQAAQDSLKATIEDIIADRLSLTPAGAREATLIDGELKSTGDDINLGDVLIVGNVREAGGTELTHDDHLERVEGFDVEIY